ncbi:MAG: PKD domain-containing protein, partial [Candidatus Helarchaeota archaeon]
MNEELIFDAGFTIGMVNLLIFLFHDGSSPLYTNEYEVTHCFPVEGYYLVTVIAVGPGGIMSQDTVEVIIRNDPPECSIKIPESAFEDEIVRLNAVEINDTIPDLFNLKYQWIMGDGNIISNETSSIEYSWENAGTYNVSLLVFDDQFSMGYDTSYIKIINKRPVANFSISPNVMKDGENHVVEDHVIKFNASITEDTPSDLKKMNYYWDFGDGSAGKGMVAYHTYTQSGVYDVKLTVIDDDGARDQVIKKIIVDNQPPSVEIMQKQDNFTISEGQTIILNAIANDTETDLASLNYLWSNGKHGCVASYYYPDNGVYNESIIVSDLDGEVAFDNITINVKNIAPQVSVHTAFVETELGVWVGGTPGSRIDFSIYKDGFNVYNYTIFSDPVPPFIQNFSIPWIFDLDYNWTFELNASYSIGTGHPPIGINPTLFIFKFKDHRPIILTHVFYDLFRFENALWRFKLNDYLYKMPISFNGTIFDPGSDDITAEIKYNNKIIKEINYFSNGSSPVEIPFEITITPKRKNSNLVVYASDDDGGCSTSITEIIRTKRMVHIFRSKPEIKINDLAPKVELMHVNEVYESTPITFYANVSDASSSECLNYLWSFGDGAYSTEISPTYNYSNEGIYLVSLTVSDRSSRTTTKGFLINVINCPPQGEVLGVFSGNEDEKLIFKADFYDSPVDNKELRYLWNFRDGYILSGREVSHRFTVDGTYPISLMVKDNNGLISERVINVIIKDRPPVVHGPFAFQAPESTVLRAEVDISDSIMDEASLNYSWEFNGKIYPSKVLSICLNDGSYIASFKMKDQEGLTLVKINVSLDFINQPPVVVVPSFIIYGPPKKLKLKAFAFDSVLDNDILTYKWFIEGKEVINSNSQGMFSQLEYLFDESGTFTGYVEVNDDSLTKYTSEFSVNVVMDSDGDGLTDEYEIIYESTPEGQLGLTESLYYFGNKSNPANHDDSDMDMLTDWYEINIYGTDPLNNDTDGDGLADGFDPNPAILTGELILGTDPLNPDTDGDLLSDGIEVLGWTISVEGPAGIKNYTVNSNPLKMDTDGD